MRQQKENRMPGFHIYQIPTAKSRPKLQWSWIFRGGRGKIIARGEFYNSKQSCVRSIRSVLKLLSAQDLCLYYEHKKGGITDLFVFEER